MTRDEARKLLSGYATGSLTELERQLLFDAALEDQDLYEELAAEQELKELIELPGAKQRLIAALGPEPEAVKTILWWPWAAGAIALASVTLALWITRPPTVEAPVQVAVVAPKELPREVDQVVPTTAPAATAQQSVAREDRASNEAEAPQPDPTPPQAKASALADTITATETTPLRAQLETSAKDRLPVLALGGAPPPAAVAPQAFAAGRIRQETSVASGDALTYEVKDTGILRIIPLRTGVLEVTFEGRPLFPSNPVVPGTPIEISVPLEAQQLRIDFAGSSNAPAPAAIQSQESTGTLVLPIGPNPRAVALIPAKR
ncbi:MAG: hypothetical protein ABIR70_13370 [Bryobacteraceae bacterium]